VLDGPVLAPENDEPGPNAVEAPAPPNTAEVPNASDEAPVVAAEAMDDRTAEIAEPVTSDGRNVGLWALLVAALLAMLFIVVWRTRRDGDATGT